MNFKQPTQAQIFYHVCREQTEKDMVMMDLLFGSNPISDVELNALIAKRPHVYSRYAGYLGTREIRT